jgi:hypothetical protein
MQGKLTAKSSWFARKNSRSQSRQCRWMTDIYEYDSTSFQNCVIHDIVAHKWFKFTSSLNAPLPIEVMLFEDKSLRNTPWNQFKPQNYTLPRNGHEHQTFKPSERSFFNRCDLVRRQAPVVQTGSDWRTTLFHHHGTVWSSSLSR